MTGSFVPLWGDQTEAALASFGSGKTPRELLRAYGEVKKAALLAQQETSKLYPEGYFPFLLKAADEVIAGTLDEHFPLPLRQGGAGTSLHMNVNEVVAARANKLAQEGGYGDFKADPLDHVNRFQSTNDTFPTAVKIVVFRRLVEIEKLTALFQEVLVERERTLAGIVILGRTELQDALPMTLGQVFGSWAGMLERDRWRLHKFQERVRLIALGGTAVGNCFSAPREYVFQAEKQLRAITGLPLCRSQNLPDEVAHQDSIAEAASGLRISAGNLTRIAADLLLYTSSPIGELRHPALQYGSTIMPMKTNPVLLEFLRGTAFTASREALLVMDFADEGQFQLNAYLPFLIDAFIRAADSLASALKAALKAVPLLTPVTERIEGNLASSPALLNALLGTLGYRDLKRVAEALQKERLTGLEAVVAKVAELTGLDRETLMKRIDPNNL